MNRGTKSKACLIISIFLLGMICVTATGRTIYVDTDASGANDGSSWNNAYRYLQDALADANQSPKPIEIRVGHGVYRPDQGANQTPGNQAATFELINSVTLKGGYAGFGEPDPNARDTDSYETILIGDLSGNDIDVNNPRDLWKEPTRRDNSYHVVTGSGTNSTAVIDGFTITGGHSSSPGGGGIFNMGGNPTLRNCTLSKNSGIYAGGMYNWFGSPTLTHCKFIGNSVEHFGAGLYNEDSGPTLTNCIFIRNATGTVGAAGMHNENSSPNLDNCAFIGNSTFGDGGGMSNLSSNPTVSNCTFTGNLAYKGGGICNIGNSNPTITNCILWGNSDSGGTDEAAQISGVSQGVNYCCIQGLTEGLGGIGNIGEDPCFIEPGHWEDPCNTPTMPWDDIWIDGDYHLKSQAGRWDANEGRWTKDEVTSPCIDAGNPGCPLGDEPVPNGNRRNMGAYGGTAEASKSSDNWRSIADLTNDWAVDYNDLKVFFDYWLETGECIPGDLNRNQSTNFADFSLMANNWHQSRTGKSVFDFGVATKGPLHLSGNIEPEGVNISIESDVYIVSENSNLALKMIGNSHITGDVFITNPDATVDLQGGLFSIGGETGEAALDHVHTGVDPIAFPVPNPSYFEHYVVEDINLAETTFTNVRIPPNTNPIFNTGVNLMGVVFIETPNVVIFSGNVNITGIIVGDGDVTDDSGTSRIDFMGTVNNSSVSNLPAEFGDLREETGTFLMAPGFSVTFGGNVYTINGAIAANGIEFYGNAGGTIEGSVLNYSDRTMELSGNNDLYFNRFVNTEIPAGFE